MSIEKDEILRYVSNLKVSKDFLNELEVNKDLQIEVTNLKNDLFIMENVSDSDMFLNTYKKPEIVVKDNIIESFTLFFRNTPLLARGNNSNTTYISDNVEVSVMDTKTYINIKSIIKSCIIKYNNDILVETSNSTYSTHLEKKGNYTIIVDNKEYSIIIL